MILKKQNILFRCDGSNEIGMGHVVRCLALADELHAEFTCNVTFAMRQSELGIQKVRDSYPVIVAEKNDFNYELWLTNCIQETKANILILDMRDGLPRYASRNIKQITSVKVITIDDPEDKRLEADLAFYPPVPQVRELNWTDFKGNLYVGWEYVILRKEFLNPYPKPENDVPNILISMGATDPENMTVFVAEALAEIQMPFHAQIIVGNGYEHKEKLFEKLSRVNFPHQVLVNPPNIAELMSKSDLAIISFGQTAYELAALSIPAVYLCLTDDHCQSATVFEKEKMGVSLGVISKCTKTALSNLIIEMLGNLKAYASLSSLSADKFKISDRSIAKIIAGII